MIYVSIIGIINVQSFWMNAVVAGLVNYQDNYRQLQLINGKIIGFNWNIYITTIFGR